jgi:glycine cleavage system aminomethyltransferase T
MTMISTPPISRTPLHHWHEAHGARFLTSDGWQVPAVYTSAERETAAALTGLALADISAVAKMNLLGAGVPTAVQFLAGDSPAARPRGVARLTGNSPVLACRLAGDHLLLLASTPNPAVFQ